MYGMDDEEFHSIINFDSIVAQAHFEFGIAFGIYT